MNRLLRPAVGAAVTAFAFTVAAPAAADEVTAATAPITAAATVEAPASPSPGFAELAERQAALEARLDAMVPAKTAADFGRGGLRIVSPGGYELRFRPVVQTEAHVFFNDDKAPRDNEIVLRRIRLPFEGRLPAGVAFKIQPDFSGGKVTLLDGYVDVMPLPWLGVRAGKYKVPIGLERLLSAPTLMFTEPGAVTSLLPNRDVGAQVQGTFGKGELTYALGVFNGAPDGGSADGDTNDEKDVVARVFSEPFAGSDLAAVKGLGLGVGASQGNQRGAFYDKAKIAPEPALPSIKSAGGTKFFSYRSSADTYANTALADGANRRIVPQAYWYYGPLGLVTEYARTQQNVKRGGASDTVGVQAWTATLGFVLTGEKATPKGVEPEHPLGEGAGAWQVVGRAGGVVGDADAFPTYADPLKSARAARSWGAALNWYATANLRATAAFEKTKFELPGAGAPKVPDENFGTARLQVSF